jgi:uncharacterized RDD family membrane protein YckC
LDPSRRYKITEIPDFGGFPNAGGYGAYRQVQLVRGWMRLGHYFLDFVILQGVSMIIRNIWPLDIPTDLTSITQIEFLILQLKLTGIAMLQTFVFYVAFEGFLGTSPGKMLLGRVVIDEYGERPSLGRIVIRTLCRLIPFEAISCLFPRGWHDMISKTYVVSKQEADFLWDKLTKMENPYSQPQQT